MLYVRIIWKKNPTKVTNTTVAPERLADYQANLGSAWDDIETFTVSVNPIPDAVPEVELHNFDLSHDPGYPQLFNINVFDRDDRKVAAVRKVGSVKLQEFALRILQQTTYAFRDAVR